MLNLRHKGFTLIELLIATTIFATVMVMALATFSWAASYNSILREIRVTSNDGKYVMSEISKDIRMANGLKTMGGEQRGEISFVRCSETYPSPDSISSNCNRFIDYSANTYNDTETTEHHTTCDGTDCWNGVLILNGDDMTAYYTLRSGDNYITRKATGVQANDLSAVALHDARKTSVKVDFYGKLTKKEGRIFQPYVIVEVNTKSKDYESLPNNSRYKFQLETVLETRDYN